MPYEDLRSPSITRHWQDSSPYIMGDEGWNLIWENIKRNNVYRSEANPGAITRHWYDESPSYIKPYNKRAKYDLTAIGVEQSQLSPYTGGDGGNVFSDILGIAGDIVPYVAPALSLIQGLFGESPEEQAKRAAEENIRRTVQAIKETSAMQRQKLSRYAGQNRALALEAGARRKAASGYAGDVGVFTNPDVSAIEDDYTANLSNINDSEKEAILRAEAQYQTQPAFMYPNSLDYVESAFGHVNRYLADRERARIDAAREKNVSDILSRY